MARSGDQWLPAIYTDKGWATADGVSLLSGVTEWRPNGQEEGQGSQGDGRVQARNAANRQARPRQRAKSQKPETGDSHCTI